MLLPRQLTFILAVMGTGWERGERGALEAKLNAHTNARTLGNSRRPLWWELERVYARWHQYAVLMTPNDPCQAGRNKCNYGSAAAASANNVAAAEVTAAESRLCPNWGE